MRAFHTFRLAKLLCAAAGVALTAGCGGDNPVQPGNESQLITAPPVPAIVSVSFPLSNVIAYTSTRYNPNGDVTLISLDGTTRKRIAAGTCPDIAPTGDAIAYRNNTGAITVVTASGAISFASSLYGCPKWSPDGSKLLVSTDFNSNDGNGVLAVVDRSGTVISKGGTSGWAAWSHDGKRLAVASCFYIIHIPCTISSSVVAYDSIGVGTAYHAVSPGGSPITFSPDGQRVTFACGSSVCVAPSTGGAGTVIATGGQPRWSPTDNTIAYVCAGFICTIDASGGTPKQFAVAATNIEWSPDGKAIQAQSGVANTDLYLVNADGSNLRNLTNDRGRDFLGSWASVSAGASTSPASAPRPLTSTVSLADDDIVYQSLSVLTDPSTGRVALIRSDGSHDRRLFNVELPEGCPVASPDRRLVAFLSLGLWVAAVDGSVERQIADTATATFGCAAWSPDGKYLAWINRRGGSVDPFQLWVAALDGSPPRVVAGSQGMYGITWAANSQSLWYADAPPGFPRQLMRVSISGGPTVFGAADWSFPSQRSDGRIAVGCGGMICTAGPNGESPQTLVAGSEPFWSPDGTHIGFFREEDINTDRGELYWMNADGSSVHQLTSIDEHPAWMSWSPKGDAISFIAHKAVNVVRLAGPSWSVITSGHWGDMTSWGSNSVPILF